MTNNGKTLYTLLKACCACNRLIGMETHEKAIEEFMKRPIDISHGYCESCYEKALQELEETTECQQV